MIEYRVEKDNLIVDVYLENKKERWIKKSRLL